MRFAAVVLAAGKSQRMGRNKLLLKVAGQTILDHVIGALKRSRLEEVFVVIGHRPEELMPVIKAHDIEVVSNTSYEEGMASSIKAGLERVTSDAAFIVLGDQLGLDADLLDRMMALMESDLEAFIVSPIFEGRRGHPILLRRALFHEIIDLKEGQNLKDVVLRHETNHRLVEGSIWSIMDIDTPDDFEKAKRLWRSMSY